MIVPVQCNACSENILPKTLDKGITYLVDSLPVLCSWCSRQFCQDCADLFLSPSDTPNTRRPPATVHRFHEQIPLHLTRGGQYVPVANLRDDQFYRQVIEIPVPAEHRNLICTDCDRSVTLEMDVTTTATTATSMEEFASLFLLPAAIAHLKARGLYRQPRTLTITHRGTRQVNAISDQALLPTFDQRFQPDLVTIHKMRPYQSVSGRLAKDRRVYDSFEDYLAQNGASICSSTKWSQLFGGHYKLLTAIRKGAIEPTGTVNGQSVDIRDYLLADIHRILAEWEKPLDDAIKYLYFGEEVNDLVNEAVCYLYETFTEATLTHRFAHHCIRQAVRFQQGRMAPQEEPLDDRKHDRAQSAFPDPESFVLEKESAYELLQDYGLEEARDALEELLIKVETLTDSPIVGRTMKAA